MSKLKALGISDLPEMLVCKEAAELNIAADLSRLCDVRRLIRTVWNTACPDAPDSSKNLSPLQKMELATTELLSNIIRHSYPEDKAIAGAPVRPWGHPRGQQIHIEVVVNCEDQLIVHISHNGLSFEMDFSTISQIEQPQEGGMGLFLISSCVDQMIQVCPEPERNLYWLINHPVTREVQEII